MKREIYEICGNGIIFPIVFAVHENENQNQNI
jgi:hypothetical protein